LCDIAINREFNAMIRAEHLAYFKVLFEGRASISWNAWFKLHEAELAQDLPRAAFLRLKFHKLDEAEKLLHESGIKFAPSPLARREKYYSLLHPSVLDENGRPKESFRRKAYDGAFGCFLDGQPDEGKAILASHLRKLKLRPILKRAEGLEEMCFDGEMEFEFGEPEIGRIILELVASLDAGNDLLDPSILRARQVLRRGQE
jgi:hypothetical protein